MIAADWNVEICMKRILFLFFMALAVPPVCAGEDCPPQGYSREQLLDLRAGGFEIESVAERDVLALSLTACLSEPDPAIRDGVVFEGLSTWLRAGLISPDTLNGLYASLLAQLANTGDTNGFQQPFAALVLSEVARTDRIDPWMTPAMRNELVLASARYLSTVSDYRGFSETGGWRHGVAHGSDLVLQLVLNPNIDAGQLAQLMNAVAVQVAPVGAIFYIYGEPGRLARAVFYAYTGGEADEAFWEEWFERVSNPAPLDAWGAAFTSQAGLARRHNTMAFLLAMHLNASSAEGEQAERLDALVMQAITRM
jgi:hypothetical protein